jgi:PKD repeat protein
MTGLALKKLVMRFPTAPRTVPLLAIAGMLATPSPAVAAPSAWFSFAPATPLTDEPVTFTSEASGVVDPQKWDLDGDGSCDDATGTSAERSFPVAAQYSVSLCATDGMGGSVTATRKITVLNRAPNAGFTYAPASPMTGEPMLLTSIAFDAEGPIAGLAWDLNGDGVFDDATGAVASVTFTTPGTHVVSLMASDRDGATNVASAAIVVREPPPELLTPYPIVRLVATVGPTGTRVRELDVSAPDHATVRLRCSGRGCAFHRMKRRTGRRASVLRIRRLGRRWLRPGAVVQVWVTKPNTVGKYTRFRIRRAEAPSRADRCVMPGARRPSRCPGS